MMYADQGLWPLGLMARGYDVGGGWAGLAMTLHNPPAIDLPIPN